MKNPKDIMERFHDQSNDINNMIRGLPNILGQMLKGKHSDGMPYWQRVTFPDKVFNHKSVELWVKSESRAGLGMSISYLFSILKAHDDLMGAGHADDVRDLLADHGVTPATGQREKAGVVQKHGGARKQGDNITLKAKRGTSADYLLAKLNRDKPAIAKAYADGKYKSVRAAAIAAGIIKVKTPVEKAVKAFSNLEYDDMKIAIEEINTIWDNQ